MAGKKIKNLTKLFESYIDHTNYYEPSDMNAWFKISGRYTR